MAPEEYLKLTPKAQRSYALKYQNSQPESNHNTIYNILTAVSSFLEYHDAPIKWRRSRIRQRPDVSSHVFSNGDLSRMFAVGNVKEKSIISLACSLGWEMSGFLQLKRDNLRDLIDRAKDTGEQYIYFKSIRQKTGALRLGVLNPLAVEWLDKWLKASKNSKPRPRKNQVGARRSIVSDVYDIRDDAVNMMLKLSLIHI